MSFVQSAAVIGIAIVRSVKRMAAERRVRDVMCMVKDVKGLIELGMEEMR